MFLTGPPLSGHERAYLFQLCQTGHLGEMSVRKEAPRAFSLNFFQLSLTGNQLLVCEKTAY